MNRMQSPDMPRVGFVARNTFQAAQLVPLVRAMNGTLLAKPKLLHILQDLYPDLKNMPMPSSARDGEFSVLVSHGPFSGIEKLIRTRSVMVQYGYAKSKYNYGSWRALADLNLVYGPHAAEGMARYAPVWIVGHPMQSRARRAKPEGNDPKRVLYAPTWGDLSSITHWADEIAELGEDYDLILKPHHNTVAREPKLMTALQAKGGHLAPANTPLMDMIKAADVVISDYSGAIFDAILADTPVVLVDAPPEIIAAEKKLDVQSLEIAQRDALGLVAEKGKLRTAIASACMGGAQARISREVLFADVTDPLEEMVLAIKALARGEIVANSAQRQAQSRERARMRWKALRWKWLLGTVVFLLALGVLSTFG